MVSLRHILISNLVVTILFMHSLPGMILLYLTAFFYTEGVFAWDIITFVRLTIIATRNKLILVVGNILYASLLRHSMDSTEMPFSLDSPQNLKLAWISLCCLLYLQHKFWLKTVSFAAAEISTCQMYVFHGINITIHLYFLW